MKATLTNLGAAAFAATLMSSVALAQEVKVGVVLATTGTFAFVGAPVVNAMKLAVDELNAKNYFAPRKPRQNRNQYVATLGGPVRHDKTFFFADFQGNNMRIGRAGALFTLPVDAYRQGNLSQARYPIYDPLTGNADASGRQPFSGNMIPSNRLSPVALNVLKNIPQPLSNVLSSNYAASTLFSLDSYSTDVRLDHRFGSNTNVFLKYSYFQFNDVDPGIFGDFGGPSGSELRG